ncbi:MAG: bile acid:sodium symporter, partial [Deltaproteobacteria bacterium]|nr:bile acid:sodium symporter [Deltaproteobacteria bacterium]
DDFRRVMSVPRAVIGGTLGQLILLPLMTWALVTWTGLTPAFAAGAMILAATPGAGMSNVMAAVAGANVALSVTLTAVSSLLAVISLPAFTAFSIEFFFGNSGGVDVPVLTLAMQLGLFLALPIGFGMLVRSRRPEASKRYVTRANRAAVVAILLLTVLGAISQQSLLPSGEEFVRAMLAAGAWTLFAMAIGWGLGWLLSLNPHDRFTFVIEFAARNLAITIIVAVGSLGRLDLGVFAGAYSMTGFPLVILLSVLRGRR